MVAGGVSVFAADGLVKAADGGAQAVEGLDGAVGDGVRGNGDVAGVVELGGRQLTGVECQGFVELLVSSG